MAKVKRQRKVLTIAEKVKAVEDFDGGLSVFEVSRKYDLECLRPPESKRIKKF